jgi:ligand-binding SRPBCC domain-containing protein
MSERVITLLEAGARPATGLRHIHTDTVVPVDLATTFAFFSDAGNLERLTPPWINFRILSPLPIAMSEGTTIDYRIVLYGLPIPWRTRIDVWEPGRRFVDRQIAGPYRWWRHEHRFEPHPDGTRVIDDVEYVPRFAAVSGWLVARDVGRIFAYRQQALGSLLATRPTC